MGILDWFKTQAMSEKQFTEREISKFKSSRRRQDMFCGSRYFAGDQDILRRKREVIGEDGKPQAVENLPNNRLVNNQYRKLVQQKTDYIVSKPLTLETENKAYQELLADVFGPDMHKKLRKLGEGAYNEGIAWLHPYWEADGSLAFKVFEGHEILPFWKDSEHTELDYAVRIYAVEAYEGYNEVIIEKAEIYTLEGVERYVLQNNSLVPDVEMGERAPYVVFQDAEGEKAFNWARIPLIAFKANDQEQPLIQRLKGLQDSLNEIISDFKNNMQEDARNTILVLQNYDGTNLGEFRRNLAQYGAVKVRTVDGAAGGISTLQVQVNAGNYESLTNLLKKAIIENGCGYDVSDLKNGNTPNEMTIKSIYNDIDLDANALEVEFQFALRQLLWFVNAYFAASGKGSFDNEQVDIIFNRDTVVMESTVIEDCQKSVGILSKESIIANHPWTKDVAQEVEKLDKEQQAQQEQYNQTFNNSDTGAQQ